MGDLSVKTYMAAWVNSWAALLWREESDVVCSIEIDTPEIVAVDLNERIGIKNEGY